MYAADTWALKKPQETKLEVAEMRMLRRMCGVMKLDYVGRRAMEMKIQEGRKRGRPKRRWLDKAKDDIKEKGPSADELYDSATWRRMSSYMYRPHIKLVIRWRRRRNGPYRHRLMNHRSITRLLTSQPACSSRSTMST